jgi:peroxin-13
LLTLIASTIPGVSATTTATPNVSTSTSTTATSQPPELPAKPSSLSAVVNRTASNYGPYNNTTAYGATPYGGYGGYNSYASPYSRFSAMGTSMYGGYGGMYGAMNGMGGMYGGYPGRPGMMGEDPNSLTNSFSRSTQATFQIIESIVGAFGGFAQMLESTYMATHSSFFGTLKSLMKFSTNIFKQWYQLQNNSQTFAIH